MNKEDITKAAVYYAQNSEENFVAKEIAISEKVIGMKIFEPPVFAFGSPDDGLFAAFREASVIGENFMPPKEWMPEAKTVISFFLPFTEEVKEGNKRGGQWPSEEWLHGRIEGQAFLNKLCTYLKKELKEAGYESVVPSLDERFKIKRDLSDPVTPFASNWSERHAAFVCGLGTFGLSKGLITKKGMAGRFGSVITDLYLPPDKREYTGIYEYCSMCGACGKKCPVGAISIKTGKNHVVCSNFLKETSIKYKPRYGCGKCQVGVPCESRIPAKR